MELKGKKIALFADQHLEPRQSTCLAKVGLRLRIGAIIQVVNPGCLAVAQRELRGW
jgi:hypothetical protein